MKVWLKQDWYAQDGNYYRAKDNPHDFPNEYMEFLPTTAKVGDKEKEAKPASEIRGDKPPIPQVSPADIAAKDAEIARLNSALAQYAGTDKPQPDPAKLPGVKTSPEIPAQEPAPAATNASTASASDVGKDSGPDPKVTKSEPASDTSSEPVKSTLIKK